MKNCVAIPGTITPKKPNGALRAIKAVPVLTPEAFESAEVNTEVHEHVTEPSYRRYEINLDEEIAPPPVAMSICDEVGNETILFSKYNFSIGTGAAKSKKTFLASLFMAAAVCGKLNFLRCPSSGMNVWFDTEQSRHKAQQIGKRVVRLAGTKENFRIFSLRALEPSERMQLIEKVLMETPNLNFVVIDGIIDLDIDPILQADQAQKIIQNLMRWTEQYAIHIFCILHYNKNITTLLGHLGSFGHRKADAIISVTKDKNNDAISIVEAVDTREKPFAPFSFLVDVHGMPHIIGAVEKIDPSGKKALLAKDIPEPTHRKHAQEIFANKPEGFSYADLRAQMILKYQEYGIEFGESKAREFINHCDNLGIIVHNSKKGKAAKYFYQPDITSK